ncbi:hypothetical protein PHMEG_0009465 [Phytophthora megakarya]|uniref:PI-PLC Y-box domain-containing protein n=1 Tax=Phytophthora megakarya TaxID=4795 RepID=A0A225WI71_9STRA|nr:hypothetical protein PHMEG_0009465 [Phytophthora megakarya]
MRVDSWNFDPSTHWKAWNHIQGFVLQTMDPQLKVTATAFIFFAPPCLWRRIAMESNRYYKQNLNRLVDCIHAAAQIRGATSTRNDVMQNETKRHKNILPKELAHCIGLFIAGMLCLHKRRFADHWATTTVGAVPKSTFG